MRNSDTNESYRDADGYITYPNGFRWHETDLLCVFTAREWHGGQGSALYALGCGDYSPDTVCAAAIELEQAQDHPDAEVGDGDCSAQYDLSRWAEGIQELCTD